VELSELKTEMEQRFEQVDRRFDESMRLVSLEFDKTRLRFENVIALIFSEGERTRRHFDIVAEGMKSERNLAIDKALAVDERTGRLTAANAADHVEFSSRLDDHEHRLADLERNEHE